ncbi:MAG: type II toxin-antitoxin system VapB family antitoxin [Clostridia bacterium]|nr:type II toxin-antitoxin system VapB family antitoxin [Clostridia bacterium]
MRPLKKSVSITIDSDLLEKVKVIAELDDRSFSQVVNLALKEYVKKNDIKKRQ